MTRRSPSTSHALLITYSASRGRRTFTPHRSDQVLCPSVGALGTLQHAVIVQHSSPSSACVRLGHAIEDRKVVSARQQQAYTDSLLMVEAFGATWVSLRASASARQRLEPQLPRIARGE